MVSSMRTTPKSLVVGTPYPDPKVTARKLGMTREQVAYVEELIAAAAHRKSRPPNVRADLRRLMKRVERGEAVPAGPPGAVPARPSTVRRPRNDRGSPEDTEDGGPEAERPAGDDDPEGTGAMNGGVARGRKDEQ